MACAESELATADAELVVQQTEASAYLLAQQTVPYQDRVLLYQASMIVAGRSPSSVSPEQMVSLPEAARSTLARATEVEARIEAAIPAARRRIRRRFVHALAPCRSHVPSRRGPRSREHRAGHRRPTRAGPLGAKPRDPDDDQHDLVRQPRPV